MIGNLLLMTVTGRVRRWSVPERVDAKTYKDLKNPGSEPKSEI